MDLTTKKFTETEPESLENDQKTRKRKNPFSDRKEDKERRQKKKARLIVRNISYKCKEEDLKEHFTQYGLVEEVNILKRPDGRLVGCAFVQFETINQATKAILRSNNKEIKGRAVFVDWAIGKDEFIQKNCATKVKNEKVKSEKVKKEKDESKIPKKKLKLEKKEECESSEEGRQKSSEDEGVSNDNNEEAEETEDSESATDDDDDDDDSEDEESMDDDDDDADSDDDEDVDIDVNIDADKDDEGMEDDDDADADEEDSSSDVDNKEDSKLKDQIEKVTKEKYISNDVKEGCTVFLKNIPFDIEDIDLRKLCRKYGPIYYSLINRESVSGHSKGTAFIKFKNKESADLCLQAGSELVLNDQIIEPFPALSKDEMRNQINEKTKSKEGKDSRNLYLAREGLIMSGSKAAEGVSASDMIKRHKLERIKTQVLKNLNRFVSRNRLSIHNLPLGYDNEKLRAMALAHTGFRPHECRVMRENKITAEHPKGKSKGFGFLSFSTHQEALNALRKLNNNPVVFNNQHRPIVAFSIEDRAVHKVKAKRALKSKLNNPTYREKLEKRKEARMQKRGKRPKSTPHDNKAKLQKHIKNLEEKRAKAAKKRQASSQDGEEAANFVGTAAKPGTSIRMRSNKKINEQAKEHRKRVRENKRKEKQRKIRQIHLSERKAEIRPKQGRKRERDDLEPLVKKYKNMLSGSASTKPTSPGAKVKKSKIKRKKWFSEN